MLDDDEVRRVASSYLPRDRRVALARGEGLPSRSAGAVLFADMAGFTPLTRQLVEALGARRGAEELTEYLARLYGALVEQIHRWGGSVIGFAGDAVMCWFDGDDGARAGACAEALQRTMAAPALRVVSGEERDIALRIGIAVGTARRAIVGNPDIQLLDVLAGDPVDRAVAAERRAAPGESVLDGELPPRAAAPSTTLEEGPAPALEASRPWILAPVFQRIASGRGELQTELRLVAPMFVAFDGIDFRDDEAAMEKLAALVSWVQRTVDRYGGTLLDVTLGDKGGYLYAAFGAPRSQEDDLRRAVEAAWELLHPPGDLAFVGSLRIGIARGVARAGSSGSADPRAYVVQGDEVNLAARLATRAEPRTVLVSRRVVEGAPGFTFEASGTVALKGVGDVELFRLERRHASSPAPAPARSVVGREPELRVLGDAIVRLAGGASSAVVLEAEAGTGKSILIAAATELAAQGDVLCASGASDAIRATAPYFAWRSVIRSLAPVAAALSCDTVPARARAFADLAAGLGPAHARDAALFEVFVGAGLADEHATEDLRGEAQAHRTNDLAVALLSAEAARRPLVLFLEDVHWMDSASLALLRRVHREVSPLLLVVTSRPFDRGEPPEFAELKASPDTSVLRLAPLGPDATIEMVCRTLGVGAVPDAVRELLLGKAEGHPLFSEQIALALRDAGVLEIADGRCTLAGGERALRELEISDSVQGVITSRIDRMPQEHRLTLKVASVIGRFFAWSLLQGVHPESGSASATDAIREQLRLLDELDITPQREGGANPSWMFKHIITQQVTYEMLPFALRRELHRSIARALESAYEDRSPWVGVLAHHHRLAEDPVPAVHYAELAGDRALANFASLEALEHYGHALELSERLPEEHRWDALHRARVLRKCGQASYGLGRIQDARDALREAAITLGHGDHPHSARLVGSLLWRMVRHALPGSLKRLEARAPADAEQRLEAAQIYDQIALVYFLKGELVESLHAVFASLDHCIGAGSAANGTRALSRSSANVGSAYGNIFSYHSRARALLDHGRRVADESDSDDARAWARTVDGIYQLKHARWDAGIALFEDAEAIHERTGDVRKVEEGRYYRALVAWNRGRVAEGREHVARLRASAERRGDVQMQLLALGLEAWDRLQIAGEPGAEALERGIELLGKEGHDGERVTLTGVRALLLARGGPERRAEALTALETAGAALERSPSNYVSLYGYYAICEASALLWGERGEASRVEAIMKRALGSLRQTASTVWSASMTDVDIYQAILARHLGRLGKARGLLRSALEKSARFGQPIAAGRAKWELARLEPASSGERGRLLAEAISDLRPTGERRVTEQAISDARGSAAQSTE